MKGINREAKAEVGSPKSRGGWDRGEGQKDVGGPKKVWEAWKTWEVLTEVDFQKVWEDKKFVGGQERSGGWKQWGAQADKSYVPNN